jgi:K+ transporter
VRFCLCRFLSFPGRQRIASDPGVLVAFNPLYGVSFLLDHGLVGRRSIFDVTLATRSAKGINGASSIKGATGAK